MKVFAISDLHLSINNPKPMDIFGGAWENYVELIISSWEENVSDEDLVLISGDISWAMTLENAKADLDFIGRQKGIKIITRGNHDYWWNAIGNVRNALTSNTYAVQNDCVKFNDFIICGSRGWTTPERGRVQSKEDEKIYKRELIRMEMSLQSAKKQQKDGDKLIVMIHYPPFNIRLDPSPFTELFKNYNVNTVVYGHLHGRDCKITPKITLDGIDYFLTSCDLVRNKLVQIY